MRRDHRPARLAVASGATAALVAAAAVFPSVTGAPGGTVADMVVIVGFCAAAIRLTLSGRQRTAAVMGLAAAVWTITGLATSLPEGLSGPTSRLVLVPHALVVTALAVGQTRPRWLAAPVLLAAVAAAAAGGGLLVPVLGVLGAAVLATLVLGRSSSPPVERVTTALLGVALVVVDPHVLGDALDPHALATVLDVVLLGVAAMATFQLTADPLHLDLVPSADRGGDEVGAWLSRVLGAPRLRVAFPAGRGPGDAAFDSAGRPAAFNDDALRLFDDDGLVACVSPSVRVEEAIREPLLGMLRRLGEVARLRAECREQATAISASRSRLHAAADQESQRLERQLDGTLLARLDRIDGLLRASSGPALAERVNDVRVELLRHARGLDPLAGRSLAEALAVHRARGVSVRVADLGEVDLSSARTAWYVATEGITNATKHAPGASVRLDVARPDGAHRVVGRDSGPGGADPHGAGLQGLADRVAAAGGELSVTSGPEGTTLACALPTTGYPVTKSRDNADPMPVGRS